MKRTLYILLILVLLLPLCACGEEGEYRYDHLQPEYPCVVSAHDYASIPVKGGALLTLSDKNLDGKVFTGSYFPLLCLFDETAKVVAPLCMNATCQHSDETCFAQNFYGNDSAFFVDDDMICSIRTEVVSELGKYAGTIPTAIYYSFDGTVVDRVSMNKTLYRTDGSECERLMLSLESVRLGSKIYFDAYDAREEQIVSGDSDISHWVICYDTEKKLFTATEPFSAAERGFIKYTDTDGETIAFDHSGVGYAVELKTGDISEFDCASVLDRLMTEGKVPKGSSISRIFPLDNAFVVTKSYGQGESFYSEYFECSVSGDKVEPVNGIFEYGAKGSGSMFVYKGNVYLYSVISNAPDILGYRTVDKRREFVLDFGEYSLDQLCETENGIIFSYLLRNPDGTLEPQQEVKTVDGKTVTEFKPRKLMYATKADIVDGSSDEPWFYDPETYTFVKK